MEKKNEIKNGFVPLGLSPALLSALEKQDITQPTEIQHKLVPELLAGKDVIE